MMQTGKPKGDVFRADYNFSRAVRGKHYAVYKAGSNVVAIDPGVAKRFRTRRRKLMSRQGEDS